MKADQWSQVKDLFHAVLEREAFERSAFLSTACHDDPALRAEVERLLVAHTQSATFIEHSPAGGHLQPPSSGTAGWPTPGSQLGRYQIDRLIGAGGMGEVYAARDLELGRDVALKIANGSNVDAHARLRREAQHASQLNHPHVCTIYEVGTSEGRPFIVMEYVEGQRLADLIPRGGLPAESVQRYGAQIADALAHAHRHGVTHRDLKTANVVVTPEGRAKVLDFGLARRLSAQHVKALAESRTSVTAEGLVAGTLSCMAPETLRGEPADERGDIWALGVLLYEMATRERPFIGATAFELSAAILHEPPAPLPARVPVALQSVITRCLEKNPSTRYQQAEEIGTALEAMRTQRVGGSEPVSPGFSAGQGRRVRAAVIALAALLAIAVTSSAWRWTRSDAVSVAVGASGRPAIAVLNFTLGGGRGEDTDWMSAGVPSMLLTGLAQTRGLEIVGAERLHDTARQIGADSFDTLDKRQAVDVARRSGAGAVVVGSIFKAGAEFRIDAQLEDLSSGRVLAAESVRGTDLFALVDQLAVRIRDRVGFGDASGIRGVAEISSASLEAQRLYTIGVAASQNLRYEEAREALEAAVAIDPTFADAYMRLGFVYTATGQTAALRQTIRKGLEHADRLGERDRLRLQATVAFEEGHFDVAAPLVDELLEKFPDTDVAHPFAKRLYAPVFGAFPDPEKLFAIFQRGTIALPTSTHLRNDYGYALLERGRYADAIREFETYARQAPREPNPYDSLGEAYLLMGNPEKAIEHYTRALTIDPAFDLSRNSRAWSLATLGRYDEAVAEDPPSPSVKALLLSRIGRYREAAEAIAVAVTRAEANENVEIPAALSFLSAVLALERNDSAHALEYTQATVHHLAQLAPERTRGVLVAVNLVAGVAEIRRGAIEKARASLARQQRSYKPAAEQETWWHAALQGELALAEGDARKAVDVLSAGEPSTRLPVSGPTFFSVFLSVPLFRDALARAAVAQGDIEGAIKTYRQLLVYGPDQKWVAPFEPRYVLAIARLLEKLGDKPGARQEYARFLEFWKRADSDLPELAEARRAIARLS